MNRKEYSTLARRLVSLVVAVLISSTAFAGWKEKVLYSFRGIPDGSTPAGGVVFDAAGNLYGATTDGGYGACAPTQCGTVFQLAPPATKGDPWTETVLHIFQGNSKGDGNTPAGGLVIDTSGNLYGTTAYGGTGNCILLNTKVGCGTVYELSPPTQKGGDWTETVLYSFPSAKQGYLPDGDLVFDSAGNLYGATEFGGGYGTTCNGFYQYCGSIFKLSPPSQKGAQWKEKVLHGFNGGKDGANPNGGLVLDAKGAIYGATSSGGGTSKCQGASAVGCGTAFKLSPPSKRGGSWTETVLHRFKGGTADTNGPLAGLLWDKKGNLYGAAAGGQGSGGDDGAIFRLAPPGKRDQPWKETLLHRFENCGVSDGCVPSAGLTFDSMGNLYGTASGGGASGAGTVFWLRPATHGGLSFAVLYTFTGAPNGSYPASKVILDALGNLYGTTQQSGDTGERCGNYGCGTVFVLRP